MIKLYLIRHGNTFSKGESAYQIGSQTDLPLSPSGVLQAEALGKYFLKQGLEPDRLITGNLIRHKETASGFLKELGQSNLEVETNSALNELDFGSWEGLSPEEISAKWPSQYSDWNEASAWAEGVFVGSEESTLSGLREFLDELNQWALEVGSEAKSKTVVVFSSGGLIRYFYSFIGAEWRKYRNQRMMKELKVKTGHFCELSLSSSGLKVKSWSKSPAIA